MQRPITSQLFGYELRQMCRPRPRFQVCVRKQLLRADRKEQMHR